MRREEAEPSLPCCLGGHSRQVPHLVHEPSWGGSASDMSMQTKLFSQGGDGRAAEA